MHAFVSDAPSAVAFADGLASAPTSKVISSEVSKFDVPSAPLSLLPVPSPPPRCNKRKAPPSRPWPTARKPPAKKARKSTRAEPIYGDEKGDAGRVATTADKIHSMRYFQKRWEQPRDWLNKGKGKGFKPREDDPAWVVTILLFLEYIFSPDKVRLPRTMITRLPTVPNDKVKRSDCQYVWLYVGEGWESLSGPNLKKMQKQTVHLGHYIFARKPLNYVAYESLRAENIGVRDDAELQRGVPVDGTCAFPGCKEFKTEQPQSENARRAYERHLRTHYNVLGYHKYCAADNTPNRADNFGRHVRNCVGAWILGGIECKKHFDKNEWLM
jgi:hypothetical protein